ncbi:MAG TPA: hypothetical protein DCR43_05825 [Bacteroidales bacterium]|nr:hypothetical protein [Bacteroidales bacterium]
MAILRIKPHIVEEVARKQALYLFVYNIRKAAGSFVAYGLNTIPLPFFSFINLFFCVLIGIIYGSVLQTGEDVLGFVLIFCPDGSPLSI